MTRSAIDARAAAILAAAFAVSGWTGFAAEPDPHDILTTARARLENGDLNGAEDSAARLEELIRGNPEWDPRGIYSDRFLPEIVAAIARIRAVQERIAGVTEDRMAATTPPEADPDSDLMTFFADWASGEIGRVYGDWDRLIAEEGLSPEERAALERTHRYLQTVQFLEASMLMKVAEAGKKELLRITGEIDRLNEENRAILEENDRLQAEIQRSDAIRTRLDSVKRSTLDLARESDDRRTQLEDCRKRADGYLKAMAELIREDSGRSAGPRSGEQVPIDRVFSEVLDDGMESVRSGPSGPPPVPRMTRERLDRYRHYNRVLTENQLATDKVARIAMIETALDWMPADSGPPIPDRGTASVETGRQKPYLELFLAVLIFTTVLFGWIAFRRGT